MHPLEFALPDYEAGRHFSVVRFRLSAVDGWSTTSPLSTLKVLHNLEIEDLQAWHSTSLRRSESRLATAGLWERAGDDLLDNARAFAQIKGARDLTSGLMGAVMFLSGGRRNFGFSLLAASLTPVIDAAIPRSMEPVRGVAQSSFLHARPPRKELPTAVTHPTAE